MQGFDGRVGVMVGNDEGARLVDTRSMQHVSVGRVGEIHVVTGALRFGDNVGIDLQRDIGHVFLVKQVGQILPDATETGDDDVVTHIGILLRNTFTHFDIILLVATHECLGNAPVPAHQKGREYHAHQHGGKHDLRGVLVKEMIAGGERKQGKTKLATLRQHQSGTQGHAGLLFQADADPVNNQGFHHHQ